MKQLFTIFCTVVFAHGYVNAANYQYRVVAVNCGYAEENIYDGFVQDTFAVKGTALWYWGAGAISVEGVQNAAPAEVYETCRFEWNGDDMEYVVTGLVPEREYLIRLHFGELSTSAGARIFDIFINNLPMEIGLDIFVRNGNVANKALVLDYEMDANAAGELDILLTNVIADNNIINGIEIYSKYDENVGIEYIENNNPFRVIVNKDSKTINVTSSSDNIQEIALYNLQGTSVKNAHDIVFSYDGLVKGIYIVKVKIDGRIYSQKVALF